MTSIRHSTWVSTVSAMALIALALLISTGCEDSGGGGGGGDYGDNDPNLVVCVGDSLTAGLGNNGASYPGRLAAMTGKTVVNSGVNGARTAESIGRVRSAVSKKAGTVCILLGSNDAINGADPGSVKESLRLMIQTCKANKTRVVVGTLPPQIGSHALFNDNCTAISREIRAVAGEEGARVANLEGAFGDPSLYDSDGLHMSDSENQRLAEIFKGKL